MTTDEARAAMDVLLEQESFLRFDAFGAAEAFELGNSVVHVAKAFEHGVSVTRAFPVPSMVSFMGRSPER